MRIVTIKIAPGSAFAMSRVAGSGQGDQLQLIVSGTLL